MPSTTTKPCRVYPRTGVTAQAVYNYYTFYAYV